MVYYLFFLSFEFLQFFCWWQFLQNTTAFFTWKESSMAAPSFPGRLGYLEAAWAQQTTAFLGICFKFPRFLFWTSRRIGHFSWDFFHAWSPKSSSFPIRGSFPLCPRSMWWEIKAAALVHTTLVEFTLLSPVSLIFSSTQFLLLQTQLTCLILSDVLLIVSFSEILVQDFFLE